jgi:hypothetical protein
LNIAQLAQALLPEQIVESFAILTFAIAASLSGLQF